MDMLIGGDPSAEHQTKWPGAASTTGTEINIFGLSAYVKVMHKENKLNFIY